MHEDDAGNSASVAEAGMKQGVASNVLHVDIHIFREGIEDEEPMLLFLVGCSPSPIGRLRHIHIALRLSTPDQQRSYPIL